MAPVAAVIPRLDDAIQALTPERLQGFLAIATTLTCANEAEAILTQVVDGVCSLTGAEHATLTRLEPASCERVFRAGDESIARRASLDRQLVVHDEPYATLRVDTTRARFTPEEEMLVDLLCLHGSKAVERVELVTDAEVLDRVRALFGPSTRSDLAVRRIGDLRIDLVRHEVFLNGGEIHLTPSEFTLLALLSEEPGRVYNRCEIVTRLWHSEFAASPRVADAHVARLRRKIEQDPRRPRRLLSIRGTGYKLVPRKDTTPGALTPASSRD